IELVEGGDLAGELAEADRAGVDRAGQQSESIGLRRAGHLRGVALPQAVQPRPVVAEVAGDGQLDQLRLLLLRQRPRVLPALAEHTLQLRRELVPAAGTPVEVGADLVGRGAAVLRE